MKIGPSHASCRYFERLDILWVATPDAKHVFGIARGPAATAGLTATRQETCLASKRPTHRRLAIPRTRPIASALNMTISCGEMSRVLKNAISTGENPTYIS